MILNLDNQISGNVHIIEISNELTVRIKKTTINHLYLLFCSWLICLLL